MDSLSKEFLIEFYSTGLKLHGDTPEALRWTRAGQVKRYSWLMRLLEPSQGESLLDYGCGLGDLLGFAKKSGHSIEYTGTDINPELIEHASLRHTGAKFMVLDIEDTPLDESQKFDMVALCGVFNTRIQGATESMKNVMRLLWPHTGRTLAATFMPIPSFRMEHDMNYMDPEDVLAYARREISPKAELEGKEDLDDMSLVIRR